MTTLLGVGINFHYCLSSWCKNPSIDRKELDRRHLEEAHMKICVLDVYKRYPVTFPVWTVNVNLQQTLDDVTPRYYEAFASKYTGKYT